MNFYDLVEEDRGVDVLIEYNRTSATEGGQKKELRWRTPHSQPQEALASPHITHIETHIKHIY